MMVYLRLFHGRHDPAQELDNWGSNGPVIGPCTYIHIVYGSVIHLGSQDSDIDCVDLYFDDGLILLEGVYYGDLTIMDKETAVGDGFSDHVVSLDNPIFSEPANR